MRMFVIEASEGTVRLMLRACQEVRIHSTSFNVEELLCVKDIIEVLKQELKETKEDEPKRKSFKPDHYAIWDEWLRSDKCDDTKMRD